MRTSPARGKRPDAGVVDRGAGISRSSRAASTVVALGTALADLAAALALLVATLAWWRMLGGITPTRLLAAGGAVYIGGHAAGAWQ